MSLGVHCDSRLLSIDDEFLRFIPDVIHELWIIVVLVVVHAILAFPDERVK